MERKSILIGIGVLAVGLILFPILVASPSHAEEVRGVTHDTIKIGLMQDLTGPSADSMTPYRKGVVNYFKHTNEQGGINGRRIVTITEDDRYSIPYALAAFKKLVYKDKVLALFGMGTTQITALYKKIEKNKILTYPWSPAESTVNPLKRYVFTHTASYKDGIRVLVDYLMKDLKAKDLKAKDARVAYVAPDIVWGKAGLHAVREQLRLYGVKLSDSEILAMGPLDATTQVLSMKRKKIDYVIVHNIIGGTSALLRDAKKYGLNAVFLGAQSAAQDTIIKMAGESARNFYCVQSFNPWYSGVPGARKMIEVNAKYNPGESIQTIFFVQGWVCAMVFVEGLKRAGKNLDTESFVDGMESIKNFSTGDLSPVMNYGPEKHRGSNQVKIFSADVEKGELTAITDWMEPMSQISLHQ